LVRAYLRLVISIALKYRHAGVPLADLVAEGNCGLVTSLHKFDPERGVRFGTYAKHWVRAQIVGCVVRSSNALGGTTSLVSPRLLFKVRRERARIRAVLGEGPAADAALAQRLEIDPSELRDLLARLECRSVSLDSLAGHESETCVADTLASGEDPEERYFRGCRFDVAAAAVTVAMRTLDARERFIAEHRFMAAAPDELSLAQIAREWGLSRERVRQLEERAKHKLEKSSAIRRSSSVSEWFVER
jgi:RNA polymerase sigma-32 factor